MKDNCKYIVKLNMISTQDRVYPYIKEVEVDSLKDGRLLIKALLSDYKLAFKKYPILGVDEYQSVVNHVYKIVEHKLSGIK